MVIVYLFLDYSAAAAPASGKKPNEGKIVAVIGAVVDVQVNLRQLQDKK